MRDPTRLTGELPAQPDVGVTTTESMPPAEQSRWRKLVDLARAVADADAAKIETTVTQLGESRRYLAPVAWAAGAVVLLVRGVKLLILNWRLSLIELIPAAWVWVVMWDLKQHTLRASAFRHITLGGTLLLAVLTVLITIFVFWCNTVFAFAIDKPPPRVAPAMRRANAHLSNIAAVGGAVGLLLAFAAIVVPRIGPKWLFVLTLGGVLGLLLIMFVAIPARIIGMRRQKLPPRQAVGRVLAGGALSAIAVTPGFVLDRVGLIMIGVSGLQILGFILLSIGTSLYAAGLSSVRAVKLSMKLS